MGEGIVAGEAVPEREMSVAGRVCLSKARTVQRHLNFGRVPVWSDERDRELQRVAANFPIDSVDAARPVASDRSASVKQVTIWNSSAVPLLYQVMVLRKCNASLRACSLLG